VHCQNSPPTVLSQAEVRDVGGPGLVEQDVAWLDVAVHEARVNAPREFVERVET
jgi:hypothetical protein